jgi:hypothetical protein
MRDYGLVLFRVFRGSHSAFRGQELIHESHEASRKRSGDREEQRDAEVTQRPRQAIALEIWNAFD